MQVRVGSSLSDYYYQEQGVPEGGVLSTTLFSIKINDIVKCLGNLTYYIPTKIPIDTTYLPTPKYKILYHPTSVF